MIYLTLIFTLPADFIGRNFLSEAEKQCVSMHLLRTWKGDQNDAPKFHQLLLQSFGNSNDFEAFVSIHITGEFLFAFCL